MAIENAYLMWIGNEHYPTFADYAEEAEKLGVSKRLPGAGMGKALQQPGTVVFVAHDDGQRQECVDCVKQIPCPACRPRKIEIKKLELEIQELKAQFSSLEALEKSGFAKRSLKIRQGKVDALKAEREACGVCGGKGKAELGSGGSVKLTNGKSWDYRTYTYWLRQPDKFDAKNDVAEKHMCETCGGAGTIPKGQIRGMFLPERIEYIVKGSEGEATLEKMGDFEQVTQAEVKKEPKRRCGKRHPGGVYAVTGTGKSSKQTKAAIKELVESGKLEADAVDVYGNFAVFTKPIDIPGVKRFRGIAKWKVNERAEKQAKLVMEAEEE